MSYFKKLFSVFLLSVISFSPVWAQETARGKNMIIQQPFSLKVELIKEPPDDKGTDVANVYTIRIQGVDSKAASQQAFTFLYYLDGRFAGKFSSQTLPFSFKRNFSGQTTGVHEIKIEIEGAGEEILASGKIKLEVVN